MKNQLIILLVNLITIVSLSGQEVFELQEFNSVKAYGKIEVRLVESSENYLKLNSGSLDDLELTYSINKNTLHVKTTKAVPSGNRVKVEVGFSSLNHVIVGGGVLLYNRDTLTVSNFSIESKSGSEVDIVIHSDSITCMVNKGAFVRLQGMSDIVVLKTSTGGDYRAKDLTVKKMYARMNGGSAEVDVADFLDAKVKMKANLNYKTPPIKIVKKEKMGGVVDVLEDF